MKYSKWITTTILTIGALSFVTATAVAQTFNVLHSFSGGGDGANPSTGISIDSSGNLYGTAGTQLVGDNGSVWELKRAGTGWILNPLHNFTGPPDGSSPTSRPVFGPDGSLYGVTNLGGNPGCTANGPGCGLVYRLTPTATACKASICPWVETVLYRFAGQPDGGNPDGDLTFDQQGNLYGTTGGGGTHNLGTVFELSPSNGGWTETVLYSFTGGDHDGAYPTGGVAFDSSGGLLGTTSKGGSNSCPGGCGTLFALTPENGGWNEATFYLFGGGADGGAPFAGLVTSDGVTFYGATSLPFGENVGTAFQVIYSDNGILYSVIYRFPGYSNLPYGGPEWNLTLDAAGNLYGTTYQGGINGVGSAFELSLNGETWTETVLHNFGGSPDGAQPLSNLVLDAGGNLYGAAQFGGIPNSCFGGDGCGTVYEISGR